MMPVYSAMPMAGGPFPTVLVVQEIFGVHEYIKDVCRRLAKLGLYGGADSGIPAAGIEDMKELLKAAKVPTEFVVYPDAPHAFHADYRPSYREGPARDGWKRLQEWLKRHGV